MFREMSDPVLTVIDHAVLFAEDAKSASRCDVCGEDVDLQADGDDGVGIAGRGLYLWTRGDEVRREEVPLCPSCGTAIGVMALAQWDMEEEEG